MINILKRNVHFCKKYWCLAWYGCWEDNMYNICCSMLLSVAHMSWPAFSFAIWRTAIYRKMERTKLYTRRRRIRGTRRSHFDYNRLQDYIETSVMLRYNKEGVELLVLCKEFHNLQLINSGKIDLREDIVQQNIWSIISLGPWLNRLLRTRIVVSFVNWICWHCSTRCLSIW